ncbi:hypothetical protein H6F50_08630 [Coleofasciculus sp. FACHB-712]|uniref:hypothetical protein n=1 Tax=Coleofasciculus sp. FACHB-712 TaxID=2692789 RepID=UPI0016871DA3|nr:hypothetical protein [Coleofasciculus sp. FACHB-712]MBD1942421.1 hypothetical protein [Coleofasciculus sp. FACHB-712]
MSSKQDYTAQMLDGWIYQIVPGRYGHHLEIWNPQGNPYRSLKAFVQCEEAVAFVESLIALSNHESNWVPNNEDSVRFDGMMQQLVCVECDDFIYQEWHVKPYEDSDNNWNLYAINPVIGKTEILLKRQADLQEAIALVKAKIDAIEPGGVPASDRANVVATRC